MPEEEEGGSLVHVVINAEELFHIGPLAITNSHVGALLASLLLLALALWVRGNARLVPSRMQSVAEFPVEFVGGLVKAQSPDRWRGIFTLVASLLLFILVANWLGLLPGVGTIGLLHEEDGHNVLVPLIRPASADLNFTLGLAIVTFVAFIGWGIKANGLGGYLKETFVANPAYMTPLMTPIHIISEFSRLISLSMRLFGNVFAGEVLIGTMLALTTVAVFTLPLAFFVPGIFLGLELVFGAVQALVFALLTMTYITLATSGHGGGHDEAHDDPHGNADDEGLSQRYANAGADRP